MKLVRLIAALALLVSACGDAAGPPEPIKSLPRQLSSAEQRVIDASNAFSFDLLKRVRAEETEDNVFLSPLSASMSLGMTMNGAAGNTFDEMRSTLRYGQLSQAEINASYKSLIDLLLGLDDDVEITIANSTWARKGVPFDPAFASTVRDAFDADTRTLDFALATAKDTINNWVKSKTQNRIPTIIDRIGPLDIMYLINAIYFKGTWATQFQKSHTQSAPFRLDNGTTVMVQMMAADRARMSLGFLPDFTQVAELPYSRQAFNMVIVLPPPNVKLADFVSRLDAATWARLMNALQPVEKGMVSLPRFQLSYEKTLNSTLQALGMRDAFSAERADFSKLTPLDDAHISFVKQKTFLKVDEEGTEAAAVTATGVTVVSAPPGIRVDRPFVMAIRERLTGTILFLGAIGHPRDN